MALKKISEDHHWAIVAGKAIDFLTALAPSADKDMKANVFLDGSIVLIYGLAFKMIIEPSFNRLGPLLQPLLVVTVIFAVYHIPYKAIRSCYILFRQKLAEKGYPLDTA